MKQEIRCETCDGIESCILVCDHCGNSPCFLTLKKFDTEYHFCNWSHLLKFIVAELRKESGND
jgi:hypothetical protein